MFVFGVLGMEPLVQPIILSGDSGTRLWPLSRLSFPKQFLDLVGDKTLFQMTVERVRDSQFLSPIIMCNSEHRFIVEDQLNRISSSAKEVILEPMGKNTGPAVLTAALMAAEKDENKLILILPSGHLIKDEVRFKQTVLSAIPAAKKGQVILFGISPEEPHTGYGYIEVVKEKINSTVDVKTFHEKPNKTLAEQYIAEGNHYWNSGIFLFKAKTIIEAFVTLEPEMVQHCKAAIDRAEKDLGFIRLKEAEYRQCKNISLDYAVIEKISNVGCMPAKFQWSDLGSWSSVKEATASNSNGNSKHGDVLFEESLNCYGYSADGAKLAFVGLENVIAVATKDAILITSKDKSEDVKAIVEQIKKNDCESAINHKRVYRPWGWYECLDCDERYQVKCLMVKPGAKLSLQSHHHRAEHWVVVSGSVNVTVDENVSLLSENQSTYIPIGSTHRLENPGKIPALLIEVQSGSYLGEDDIVRYEDVYGRVKIVA